MLLVNKKYVLIGLRIKIKYFNKIWFYQPYRGRICRDALKPNTPLVLNKDNTFHDWLIHVFRSRQVNETR